MADPIDLQRRAAFIQGLRDCAAFLESHPDVPTPGYVSLNAFVHSREEVTHLARLSSWEKVYNDTWFSLRKMFGSDISFDINATRETVCERVVVGQKLIPATPEQLVDEVEWRCVDSLLAGEATS